MQERRHRGWLVESAPPSTRAHEGHVPVLPRHANSFVIILIYAPVSRRAAQRRPTSAGATSFTRSWLSRPKYPCPPYYVESSTSALCYTPREERIALAFASFVWLGDETANGPVFLTREAKIVKSPRTAAFRPRSIRHFHYGQRTKRENHFFNTI